MQKEKKLPIRNGTTALTVCDIELNAPAPYKKGYPTHPTTYGEYMRQTRMDYGFTQKDIAEILNVYTSTIDKWERGVAIPNKINQNQIIHFLGYDPLEKLNTNFKN